MELLADGLNKAYLNQQERFEGIIQFCLKHEREDIECYFEVDDKGVTFKKGTASNPVVTLKSTLYTWLDLAAGRLNPIMGVITKRLRFKGDVSFLSNLSKCMRSDPGIKIYEDPPTEFEKNPHQNWRKPKNALIINASPRGEDGYTYFYLTPLINGIKSCGVDCDVVQLKKLDINPCKGCWHCWLSGTGECVFDGKDDFQELKEKYMESDLVVFGLPLYVDGMPALLKNFWERMVCEFHPYMIEGIYKTRHPRRRIKNRAVVVFATSGFLEMENFEAVLLHFRQIAHNAHFPIIAELVRPSGIYLYNNPLLYRKLKEVLMALEKAGKEIVNSGRVSRKTLKIIGQDIDTVDNFRKKANLFWEEKIKSKEKTY